MTTKQHLPIPKQRLPLLANNPNLVYLDYAATTPLCAQADISMHSATHHTYGTVHRTQYSLSNKTTQFYESARATIADIMRTTPANVIFTYGTTDAINKIAYGIEHNCTAGDNIIISIAEHHSNIVPWQQLARRKNLHLHIVPITDDGLIDSERLAHLVDKKTKIVSLFAQSNVLGSTTNFTQIKNILEKKGVRNNVTLIADAAQSILHNVGAVSLQDVDVIVLSAHKHFGPTGVGCMVANTQTLQRLQPAIFGGQMIDAVEPNNATWASIPQRFEAGTPPIIQCIGMASALSFTASIDAQELRSHETKILKYFYEQLSQINGIRIVGPKDTNQRGGCISFAIAGIDAYDVGALLDQQHICVRTGHMCAQPLLTHLRVDALIRISISGATTMQDAEYTIHHLKAICEKLRRS